MDVDCDCWLVLVVVVERGLDPGTRISSGTKKTLFLQPLEVSSISFEKTIFKVMSSAAECVEVDGRTK